MAAGGPVSMLILKADMVAWTTVANHLMVVRSSNI